MSHLTSGDRAVIRNIVGRYHVSELDSEIAQIIIDKLPNATPGQLREAIAVAIKAHHANQVLYKRVMRGGF